MIFMSVTLLNFIIAILSDTYSVYTSQKQSLFLREVIVLRSRLGYSKTDTWKVSSFVPLNILLWFFSPLIYYTCSKKDSIKHNKIMMKLAYLPLTLWAVVFYISLFIGMFVLMWTISPLTLVGLPLVLGYLVLSEMRGCCAYYCCFLCVWPFLWSLIPLLTSLGMVAMFTISFLRGRESLSMKIEEKDYREITEKDFNLIIKCLKKALEDHQCNCENPVWSARCFIATKTVVKVFQEELNVIPNILKVLFDHTH